MKITLLLLTLLSVSFAWGQFDWQHTYYSAPLENATRLVRIPATGDSLEVLLKGSTGVNPEAMTATNDGFPSFQCRFTETAYPYLGFKQTTTNTAEILPVYYNGTAMPAFHDLSWIKTDPAGDHNFNLTHLDIRRTYASFSNDKLYFGITNAGGGFPTGSGFTFYAYMATLVDPASDSTAASIVFGLMHTVNLTGIITPGLYKITGTGTNDLTLIGQITTSIDTANNTLILSCNLADLMADPDFSSWYDPTHPKIGFTALSNKITLTGGSQVSDQTAAAFIIPRAMEIPADLPDLPTLSNIVMTELQPEQDAITLDYFSAQSYLPVEAMVHFDNGYSAPFLPLQMPDFDATVSYQCTLPSSAIAGWNSASIEFSVDGVNYTDNIITPTPVIDDASLSERLSISLYPNPSRGLICIDLSKFPGVTRLELFDSKGRKCWAKTLGSVSPVAKAAYSKQADSEKQDVMTIDFPPLANGVYFITASRGNIRHTSRICIVR